MKTLRNKSSAIVAFVLMLTIAATVMTALPIAFAQVQRPTTAYLSFRPNPIGIDQTLLVNIWVVPYDTAGFDNFTVAITDPDGITETITLDSYGDGSAWFLYVPDKLGTWKLKFTWAGQTIGSYIYQPCESPEQTLTVQQEPIPSWPPAELPTDYWTRPIYSDNREWYQIGGDWVHRAYNMSWARYNPYTTGPDSAHILWTKQTTIAGIIGGEFGSESYSYRGVVTGPLAVMAGLGYFSMTDGLHCIDIHTGEELWVKEGITVSGVEHASKSLLSIGTRLQKYDAFTGVLTLDVPGMRGTYDEPYVYSSEGSGADSRLIKWTVDGTSSNFASRIVYNVSYPVTRITYVWNDLALSMTGGTGPFAGMSGAWNTTTGEQIWNKTLADTLYGGPFGAVGYDKIFFAMEYPARVYRAYDVYSGDIEWTSEQTAYPWGSFWGYTTGCAYDNVYAITYDGIYAFDVDTGKINWEYHSGDSGYETPYGTWPFMTYQHIPDGPAIADGKLYVSNFEHSFTQPIMRGLRLHCIDAITGKGIWNISGSIAASCVADGVLIGGNYLDGIIYAFSRGPTATTVSVPQTTIAKGSTVLIQGTVLDQSPAQPGTPCVSEESMSAWMEYLHMQKPAPGIGAATGVPVDLRACGSDGSVIDIGRVTSDTKGCFMCEWTPTDEDLYMITATFNGDESYYGSWAETGLSVGPEPTPYPEAPTEEEVAEEVVGQLPTHTTMDLIIIVAVIVAICLVLYDIVTVRKLRK